jgi:hypothetical protein
MLKLLTLRLRRWATAALVAMYALGVMVPTVAFASGDEATIVHSLNETHGGFLTLHVHSEGKSHKHSNNTATPGHHCCGVVALPGLTPFVWGVFEPPAFSSALPARSEFGLSGGIPDRLDRPPRSFLSI